jgi:hypothetical protein
MVNSYLSFTGLKVGNWIFSCWKPYIVGWTVLIRPRVCKVKFLY